MYLYDIFNVCVSLTIVFGLGYEKIYVRNIKSLLWGFFFFFVMDFKRLFQNIWGFVNANSQLIHKECYKWL